MKTYRPRVGVPWRTARQAVGSRRGYVAYLDAVRRAGGEPVELPLSLPAGKLQQIAETLDAFVLPGSGSDVDPKWYSASPHKATKPPDVKRESMDFAILDHALPAGKPVLAICYGAQSLNVHLGGTLVQDIASKTVAHKPKMETPKTSQRQTRKAKPKQRKQDEDAYHAVKIEGGSLARLASSAKVTVNSWHHQSIDRPGRGLNITARAPDKIVEAVEWTAGPGWALGVQWHPERTPNDPLARKLFKQLVSKASRASGRRTS